MKLSKELAKQAKKLNICQEWHDELKTLDDKRAMVRMYLKGIDFCLSNDYPSNEFIRQNFGKVMNEFGVFLDASVDLVNPKKCVALGATKGYLEVNGFSVSEVFVKHSSVLTVVAKDDAFVMVDVFDEAELTVLANGSAKVCVNRYGNAHVEVESTSHGNSVVKVVEKHKKTY